MKDHTLASRFRSDASQSEEERAGSRISRRQVLGAGLRWPGWQCSVQVGPAKHMQRARVR